MSTLSKAVRVETADGAVDAAEEAAGVRVASLEEMLQWVADGDQARLDAYLAERGSVVDWESLDDRFMIALGRDAQAIDRGTPLSPARMDRVRANVEKALVRVAREEANVLMAQEEQRAMFAGDPRPSEEKFGRWCAIGEGSCEDCISWHGVVFAEDFWVGISPADATNQCGERCRCRILPTADPGEGNEGLRTGTGGEIVR